MKKSTKQAVNKSLTPEEKAILGNIRSLLEQLDSEEISEDMDAPAIEEETIPYYLNKGRLYFLSGPAD